MRIIFGDADPYLNKGVAQKFHELFPARLRSPQQPGGSCRALPAPEKRLKWPALEFYAKAELDPTAATGAIRWNKLAGDYAEVLQATG